MSCLQFHTRAFHYFRFIFGWYIQIYAKKNNNKKGETYVMYIIDIHTRTHIYDDI